MALSEVKSINRRPLLGLEQAEFGGCEDILQVNVQLVELVLGAALKG